MNAAVRPVKTAAENRARRAVHRRQGQAARRRCRTRERVRRRRRRPAASPRRGVEIHRSSRPDARCQAARRACRARPRSTPPRRRAAACRCRRRDDRLRERHAGRARFAAGRASKPCRWRRPSPRITRCSRRFGEAGAPGDNAGHRAEHRLRVRRRAADGRRRARKVDKPRASRLRPAGRGPCRLCAGSGGRGGGRFASP